MNMATIVPNWVLVITLLQPSLRSVSTWMGMLQSSPVTDARVPQIQPAASPPLPRDSTKDDISPDAKKFLVRIAENQTEIPTSGIISIDCIVVLPDGRFRLERRRQEVNTGGDTIKVFDGALDKKQLRKLTRLLLDENIRSLPPLVDPPLPLSASRFHYFNATFAQQEGSRSVGYFSWKGEVADSASPASASESTKQTWLASEKALSGLVEWFHRIEALPMQPSKVEATQCNTLPR